MPAWPHIPEPLLDRAITPPRPESDPRVRWLAWTDAGPFRIWHKAYRSDFTQSRHAHATGSVDFNIDGAGDGTYLGRPRASSAGGVEYFRPDGDHSFRAGPRGIRVLHVLFTDAAITPFDAPPTHEPFEADSGAASGIGARILRELATPDVSSPLAIESMALELVAAMRRWPMSPDVASRAISGAMELLQAAPDCPVGLAELADEVGLHPAHLARSFRAAVGVSPGEYHRRVRVARAAESLAISDKPIAGVAGDLGFADQAHLTRWFTRIAGISPASYRRAVRGR